MRQQMMMAEQERQRQEWMQASVSRTRRRGVGIGIESGGTDLFHVSCAFVQMQQQQMMMQQQQQQQQLMAQPTGYRSNNPFAPGGGGGPSMSLIPEPSPMPQVPTPQPQAQPQQQDFFQQQPAPPPPSQQQERQFAVKTKDTNPELAALWANREGGLDTFGNTGSLRESSARGRLASCFESRARAGPADVWCPCRYVHPSQVFPWVAGSMRVINGPSSRVSGVGLGIRTRLRVNSSSSSSSNEGVGSNLFSKYSRGRIWRLVVVAV